MKFSELKNSTCFVVINPAKAVLLLAKDSKGCIWVRKGWELFKDQNAITPDTEVQPVDY